MSSRRLAENVLIGMSIGINIMMIWVLCLYFIDPKLEPFNHVSTFFVGFTVMYVAVMLLNLYRYKED